MNPNTNSCAVCRKPIGRGLLMCLAHWRLVPKAQQTAVLRSYGRWQRHTGCKLDLPPLIESYRTARDAAVASARDATSTLPATGDLL